MTDIRADFTNSTPQHDDHPLHHNDLATAINAMRAQAPDATVRAASFQANVLDNDPTLAANSVTRIATQQAAKAYADNLLGAFNAVTYKGTQDCTGNPNYPAADAGFLYRVSLAGKIGGSSGTPVEAGDLFLCTTDITAAGNQATVGVHWVVIQTNIINPVSGPGTATDGNVATWDGATGLLVKDSAIAVTSLAPKASPTFTGTPLAPTAAVDTATGQVATTEFMIGQAASSGTPAMDSTGARGSSTRYARADHVHPSDTSRAATQETVTAISNSSTAVTIPDVTAATVHRYTLTANCTFTFPTAGAGKSFLVELRQDGTGSRTATWPGTVKWPSEVVPVLTTTASKSDLLSFICTDGTNWFGVAGALNFS